MGSTINPNERQTWAITATGITVMGKTKNYNTYEEMLQSDSPGLINWVSNATGDPTVSKGAACYRYENGIFVKMYETESMDQEAGINLEWDTILNGPTSEPADIDSAVAQMHSHVNLETLNSLSASTDTEGVINALAVNGVLLATKEQVDALASKVSGALSFQGVINDADALPVEGNIVGDVYVTKDGKEFVYTSEEAFEEFGSTIDLSGYYTKEEIDSVVVKFIPNGERKFILLDNHDNICGKDTDGVGHNLIMVSKWNKADFGAAGIQLNLNSKGPVQVNDTETVITDVNYSEYIVIPEAYDDSALSAAVSALQTEVATKVDAVTGKQLSTEDFTTEEKEKLADLVNYDDTEVRAALTDEAAVRDAADGALNIAVAAKQDQLTVDNATLTLNGGNLSLGVDVVVLQNPWDAEQPNRRHIVLKNHDSLVGTLTNGDNGTLIMMSKWDKVDVGTTKTVMNLNTNGDVTVNDSDIVITNANIGTYAPVTDLSGYYTKTEIDAKVAGVLSYKGTVAAVADLPTEGQSLGDVWHVEADAGEYAWNGAAWESLGSSIDLSSYATTIAVGNAIDAAKAELVSDITDEENARIAADTALDNRITANATAIGTKVTQDIISANGTARIWNETSGGGAQFLNIQTGIKSFVGVNQGTINGNRDLYAQIYVLNGETRQGLRFNVYDDRICYTPNTGPGQTDAAENEIATKGDITVAINGVNAALLEYATTADVEENAQIAAAQVARVDGNVVSIADRLALLEDQLVSLFQTDVAVVTVAADLVQPDKDLVIKLEEAITGTVNVTGKSITVNQMEADSSTVIFQAVEDVTIKNLTAMGNLPKTTANAQFRILKGGYVRISNVVLNQTGYNAIEVGLNGTTKSVVIDNVEFNANLTNNAISIFDTEDGSVVTISNCKFVKCSNPIRLSNKSGGKVVVNLVNCDFGEWETIPEYAGAVICQDYTSAPENVVTANLFGPDKMTINFINCTKGGVLLNPPNVEEVLGSGDAATQIIYLWNETEGSVPYSAERYPVVTFK